jgi:copper chaperone
MANVTYNVPNINCNHCVHTIKMEVSEIEGVKLVEPSAETKKVVITFDAPATEEKIKTVLKEINYPVVE